jgi:hypothetical protein
MGGSGSKKVKEEAKKEQKASDENNINIQYIDNNSLDDANGLEELNLDKNDLLINEQDICNSVTESETVKREKEKLNISNLTDIKAKKEIIIPYTEKETLKMITDFYDDIIELLYCFNSRKAFVSLVKSINQKHLCNFNSKKFPKSQESKDFLESFKYSSIIIACLIFLAKDSKLYENSAKKIKENLEQFVYACLDNIDRTNIFSLKIINFIQRFRKIKKSLFGCTSGIIKILFKNKLAYKHILNCLEQLLTNINIDSTHDIITKINESILFCYNSSNIITSKITINKKDLKINPSIKNIKNKTMKNIKIGSKNMNNISKMSLNKSVKIDKINNSIVNDIDNGNNDERNESESVNAPYIRKELDKKFCLVLDIDETLSHMIKLPFGNYFLVRPGVMDLLKELYNYYEIDIFTAALKHYADNIVNKLDRDNIYISYRLYRCHCTYEDGKSVKKLSLMGRDLNKIVFVDDLKRNAKYNMKNLALVSQWIDNIYDNEIINLKNKLKYIALCGKYDEDITKGLIDEKITEDIN